MLKHTAKRILQIQFIRQLLGAAGGALVALAVYTVYREANTAVRAYLIPPGGTRAAYTGEVRLADKSAYRNDEQMARIAARARENAETLRANQQERMHAAGAAQASSSEAASVSSASSAPTRKTVAAVQAQHERTARLNERSRMETRAASGASSAAAAEALHAGAPNLPSSGVGLWVAAFMALCISLGSSRKLRMLLLPAVSRVD